MFFTIIPQWTNKYLHELDSEWIYSLWCIDFDTVLRHMDHMSYMLAQYSSHNSNEIPNF